MCFHILTHTVTYCNNHLRFANRSKIFERCRIFKDEKRKSSLDVHTRNSYLRDKKKEKIIAKIDNKISYTPPVFYIRTSRLINF